MASTRRWVAIWKKRVYHRSSPDGAESIAFNGALGFGRGDRRRLPQAHPAAVGRLPLRPSAHHPAPDALIPASLSAAAWYQPLTRGDAGDKPTQKKFKSYPIGYFHIDIAEVHTEEGRLYLFVAIDRTSKFAFAQLHEKATRRVAGDFLRALIAAVPYKIHTVLTDNGTHFTTPGNTSSAAPLIKEAMAHGEIFRAPFVRARLCAERHRAPPDQTTPSLDERTG